MTVSGIHCNPCLFDANATAQAKFNNCLCRLENCDPCSECFEEDILTFTLDNCLSGCQNEQYPQDIYICEQECYQIDQCVDQCGGDLEPNGKTITYVGWSFRIWITPGSEPDYSGPPDWFAIDNWFPSDGPLPTSISEQIPQNEFPSGEWSYCYITIVTINFDDQSCCEFWNYSCVSMS